MSQFDIPRSLYLLLFNDIGLKTMMGIPKERINDLAAFRDNYCISDANAVALVDDTLISRLVVYWDKTAETNTPDVKIRPLHIDIYVQQANRYNVTDNALTDRKNLITQRLKTLLHQKRVEGFLLRAYDLGDLLCTNANYVRCFISFQVKHIF